MTNELPPLDMRPVQTLLTDLADRGMRLHSLLVHRHGQTVLDLWQWPHEPSLKHKVHSATKSFTGTAVGFAEAEGLLRLDDPVVDHLGDRLTTRADANLSRLRIRDLLTMQTGQRRGLSGATTRLRTTGWVGEFLEEPVVEPPGRSFLYSSTTSHVLSAVVQEVSGEPVDTYLRPRLFEPLGITDYTWDRDPEGVSSGGNGLSLRPYDLLSFGVLHLQDGVWEGRRVLPTGWVQKASALHVRRAISGEWNGRELTPPPPDAAADSGYGFQFWTTESGIYNASGIFGQECMVFPDQGGVVVVTGAMGDGTYHDLPGMLRRTFLDAFDPAERDRAENPSAEQTVGQWVHNAREPQPLSTATRRQGFTATYDFDTNEQGIRSLALHVGEDSVRLDLEDERGLHTIDHGVGRWLRQETQVSCWRLHHAYQDASASILVGAEWSADTDAELHLTWHFLESPFIDRVSLTLGPDDITVERRVNVNSGPMELTAATGRLRRGTAHDATALSTDQLA
ncbi:serine hydrolase domain-containing protein [Streptomyces sp. NPDC050400]|uniref:serine hydrolase domain-containing protein n=1 Tax=Streptomyces sp. NPDC050400 TaxID=3365610 RepID=UPI0037BD2D0F